MATITAAGETLPTTASYAPTPAFAQHLRGVLRRAGRGAVYRGALLCACLCGLLLAVFTATAAPPLTIGTPLDGAVGRHASYLTESGNRLTLGDAVAAYGRGAFTAASREVLNFGIGAAPVWVHVSVANQTEETVLRRMTIETPWLDQVELFVRRSGETVAAHRTGDRQAFHLRPADSRYFAFDHAFAPGVSDVFLRIQTPDPMVVPMYLLAPDDARAREQAQDYSYGFLYGFLFALLAYNLMLYAGLRHPRYALYSLYLGMFLLMNVAYTGHGFKWIWPHATEWAQWSNPILMLLYGTSGLVFALAFLDTRTHFPRVHKAIVAYLLAACALLAITIVVDSQRGALLVAFTFVFLFTGIMLALGIMAVRSGQKPARYFLLAAIAAMLGAASTALSVWGYIPFNTWTFRAVDMGILLDATLLALALTYQFRVGQAEMLQAQQLATVDPLTGLNNRRAFYAKAAPIWNVSLRHDHALSVVLMDIDRFKRVNDSYGHAYGDEVLSATARVLSSTIREQDIAARWGGEEFILLLPETDLDAAAALAERLRAAIAGIRLSCAGDEIVVTASFGVAQRQANQRTLDAVISSADACLYQAKDRGRNRVHHPRPDFDLLKAVDCAKH